MSGFSPADWAVGHLRKLEEKGFDVDQMTSMAKGLADTALGNYWTRQMVTGCDWCPSFSGCKKALGFGAPNSPVMIVGDKSSEDDVMWGQAQVGTGGFLLTFILDKLGVDRQSVYITNLVKCHKPGVEPTQEEAENCVVHLYKEIDVVRPAVIVTLGQFAAKHLLSDANFRLHASEDGGTFREHAGYKVRPTYSLDYVLATDGDRHTVAKRTLWKDLKAAFDFADEARPGYVYRHPEMGAHLAPA